jgi:hypothetical protein
MATSRATLGSRLALPLALLVLQQATTSLAADTATVLVTTTLDCTVATPAVTQVLQSFTVGGSTILLGLSVVSASCTPANYGFTTVIAIVSDDGLVSGPASLSYAIRTINFGILCTVGADCTPVTNAGGRVVDARVPTTTLGVIPTVATVTVWVPPLAFKAQGNFQGSVSGAGTTYWNEDQIHASHPDVPLTHQRGSITSTGSRFTWVSLAGAAAGGRRLEIAGR